MGRNVAALPPVVRPTPPALPISHPSPHAPDVGGRGAAVPVVLFGALAPLCCQRCRRARRRLRRLQLAAQLLDLRAARARTL